MRDRDFGLHPSELAPVGYQVKCIGNQYYPMRECANGVYRAWDRYDERGVRTGALSFATARAATSYCRQHKQRIVAQIESPA